MSAREVKMETTENREKDATEEKNRKEKEEEERSLSSEEKKKKSVPNGETFPLEKRMKEMNTTADQEEDRRENVGASSPSSLVVARHDVDTPLTRQKNEELAHTQLGESRDLGKEPERLREGSLLLKRHEEEKVGDQSERSLEIFLLFFSLSLDRSRERANAKQLVFQLSSNISLSTEIEIDTW